LQELRFVSFPATQHKRNGLSAAFSTQVDLGAESSPRSSKRFTILTSTGTCGALMGTDDGAIHEVLGPIELTFQVNLSQQLVEDTLPNAFSRPSTEAAVNGRPLTESFRNVPPGGARSQDPEDAAHDGAMVEVGSAAAFYQRQERSKVECTLIAGPTGKSLLG